MTGHVSLSAPINQITQQPLTQEQQTFFSSFSIARAANLTDQKDGNNQESISINIDLSKMITPTVYLAGSLSYETNLRYPEYNDLSDIFLGLSHSDLGGLKNWSPTLGLNVILPASKISTRINSLQLGFLTGLGINSRPGYFKDWILGANLSLGRMFHQYSTSLNGDVLNEYVSNQSVSATYRWSQASLSIRILHRNALSYFGTLKEGIEHSQTLNIGITPAITTSIGHTNGGDIFKANGQDRNLSLINDNSSTYFVALEVNL